MRPHLIQIAFVALIPLGIACETGYFNVTRDSGTANLGIDQYVGTLPPNRDPANQPDSPPTWKLSGTCLVGSTGDSTFTSHCIDQMIELKNAKGEIVDRRRTNSKGEFNFECKQGDAYLLELPNSRWSVVQEPAGLISSEKHVILRVHTK